MCDTLVVYASRRYLLATGLFDCGRLPQRSYRNGVATLRNAVRLHNQKGSEGFTEQQGCLKKGAFINNAILKVNLDRVHMNQSIYSSGTIISVFVKQGTFPIVTSINYRRIPHLLFNGVSLFVREDQYPLRRPQSAGRQFLQGKPAPVVEQAVRPTTLPLNISREVRDTKGPIGPPTQSGAQ